MLHKRTYQALQQSFNRIETVALAVRAIEKHSFATVYPYLSEAIRRDPHMIGYAFTRAFPADKGSLIPHRDRKVLMKYLPINLQLTKEQALHAIGVTEQIYPYFSEALRTDLDIARAAIIKIIEPDKPTSAASELLPSVMRTKINSLSILLSVPELLRINCYTGTDILTRIAQLQGIISTHLIPDTASLKELLTKISQRVEQATKGLIFPEPDINKAKRYCAINAAYLPFVPVQVWRQVEFLDFIRANHLEQNPFAYLPALLRDDRDFMKTIIHQYDIRATRYLSFPLSVNRGYIIELLTVNTEILSHVAQRDFLHNSSFMLDAIAANPMVIRYTAPSLQTNIDFLLSAVERNVQVLRFFPKTLLRDQVFMYKACLKDIGAFNYIPDNIKRERHFIYRLTEDPRLVTSVRTRYSQTSETITESQARGIISATIIPRLSDDLRQELSFGLNLVKRLSVEVIPYLPKRLRESTMFKPMCFKIIVEERHEQLPEDFDELFIKAPRLESSVQRTLISRFTFPEPDELAIALPPSAPLPESAPDEPAQISPLAHLQTARILEQRRRIQQQETSPKLPRGC